MWIRPLISNEGFCDFLCVAVIRILVAKWHLFLIGRRKKRQSSGIRNRRWGLTVLGLSVFIAWSWNGPIFPTDEEGKLVEKDEERWSIHKWLIASIYASSNSLILSFELFSNTFHCMGKGVAYYWYNVPRLEIADVLNRLAVWKCERLLACCHGNKDVGAANFFALLQWKRKEPLPPWL